MRKGKNIYKRKDGRWEGRIRTDEGKYKYVYAHTYTECSLKMQDMIINGYSTVPSERTVLIACNEWLELRKLKIKESSLVKYQDIIKRLKPLHNIKIKNLKADEIYAYVQRLSDAGYADTTIEETVKIIKSILNTEINRFNCRNLKSLLSEVNSMPVCKKRQKTAFKPQIMDKIEKTVSVNPDSIKKTAILIMLYTGMRIGELCGLKNRDFDFEEGLIYVNKTVQRIRNCAEGAKTKIIVTDNKTEKSQRIIPIPDFLFDEIKNIITTDEENFFLSQEKSPIEPRHMQYFFTKLLKSNQIEDKITIHGLRHAFATRCVNSGIDIKTVSELLGHSSVQTTLNLYVHPSLEDKVSAIRMLSRQYKK